MSANILNAASPCRGCGSIDSSQKRDTSGLRVAHGLLRRLQRDATNLRANAGRGRGVHVLNIERCFQASAQQLSAQGIGSQRTVRELIVSLKSSQFQASVWRDGSQ